MAWIKTISEAEAAGELAETYALIRERNPSVSNITRAASVNPRVMRALADLLYALRGPHCALGKRRQEMIAVLTSALHRCAYWTTFHGEALRQLLGGDAQQVLDLARNWRDLPLSEADRAMLAYGELLALRPSTATADDVRTLRKAGFGDEEIFEIVMVTAYYALRCRMADGLGVDVDAGADQDQTLVEAFAYRGAADGARD